MFNRDLVETLVALALIIACGVSAIASARPPRGERAPRPARTDRRARRRARARTPARAETRLAASSVDIPVVAPPTGRSRPRILTGEPAAPEPHRPATRRAIALVGGMTALAAGGAVGLLVLVRALVAMFKRIGG